MTTVSDITNARTYAGTNAGTQRMYTEHTLMISTGYVRDGECNLDASSGQDNAARPPGMPPRVVGPEPVQHPPILNGDAPEIIKNQGVWS